jgi:hypothetical protein
MATVKHAIREHDVVVLREPVGESPAGSTGAVISVYDDTLLVEIIGPGGKTLTRSRSLPHGSTPNTPNPGAGKTAREPSGRTRRATIPGAVASEPTTVIGAR